MRFPIDAQLPPALTDWLAKRGHEASHIIEREGLGVADASIWEIARAEHSVIVTKDRDFAIWASDRLARPQVVWLRLGNATRARLFEWLEPRWDRIEQELEGGATLVEVGRP